MSLDAAGANEGVADEQRGGGEAVEDGIEGGKSVAAALMTRMAAMAPLVPDCGATAVVIRFEILSAFAWRKA
jgi:hypothetical protein